QVGHVDDPRAARRAESQPVPVDLGDPVLVLLLEEDSVRAQQGGVVQGEVDVCQAERHLAPLVRQAAESFQKGADGWVLLPNLVYLPATAGAESVPHGRRYQDPVLPAWVSDGLLGRLGEERDDVAGLDLSIEVRERGEEPALVPRLPRPERSHLVSPYRQQQPGQLPGPRGLDLLLGDGQGTSAMAHPGGQPERLLGVPAQGVLLIALLELSEVLRAGGLGDVPPDEDDQTQRSAAQCPQPFRAIDQKRPQRPLLVAVGGELLKQIFQAVDDEDHLMMARQLGEDALSAARLGVQADRPTQSGEPDPPPTEFVGVRGEVLLHELPDAGHAGRGAPRDASRRFTEKLTELFLPFAAQRG